jgi:hypothetical protein
VVIMRRFALCLVFIPILLQAHDQYFYKYGGSSEDRARGLVQTPDGGFAMAGYAYRAGSYDLALTRVDSTGAHLWTTYLGGAESDAGLGIVLTEDHGFAVAGYMQSFGAGEEEVLLSKFDSTGAHLWTSLIGSDGHDYGYGIAGLSDGGFAVAGSRYDSPGARELILSKFDSSGTHLWTKTLDGFSEDYGYHAIETQDKGIAVAGLTTDHVTGADVLLVKFDSSGAHMWSRALGGSEYEYAFSVCCASDGGLVLTGQTLSFGSGQKDVFVTKFNSSGSHLWTTVLGGAEQDYGLSALPLSDGSFLAMGATTSYGAGNSDGLISKLDAMGNHLWSRIIGGSHYEELFSAVETPEGDLVVSGWSRSFGLTYQDFLLCRLDSEGNTCIGEFIAPVVQSWNPTVTDSAGGIEDFVPDLTSPTPTITAATPLFEDVCPKCGDANHDFAVTSGDGYFILNYLGSEEQPWYCFCANVTGDDVISPADGYWLLNYLGGGPALNCEMCEF